MIGSLSTLSLSLKLQSVILETLTALQQLFCSHFIAAGERNERDQGEQMKTVNFWYWIRDLQVLLTSIFIAGIFYSCKMKTN